MAFNSADIGEDTGWLEVIDLGGRPNVNAVEADDVAPDPREVGSGVADTTPSFKSFLSSVLLNSGTLAVTVGTVATLKKLLELSDFVSDEIPNFGVDPPNDEDEGKENGETLLASMADPLLRPKPPNVVGTAFCSVDEAILSTKPTTDEMAFDCLSEPVLSNFEVV